MHLPPARLSQSERGLSGCMRGGVGVSVAEESGIKNEGVSELLMPCQRGRPNA
jgi:hypothetical protein